MTTKDYLRQVQHRMPEIDLAGSNDEGVHEEGVRVWRK